MMQEKGYTLSKEWLSKYREQIKERYGTSTVNSHIAAINQYLKYRNIEWSMQYVRIQKNSYIEESKEFHREEYDRAAGCLQNRRKTMPCGGNHLFYGYPDRGN